jgi:unsaturated rhamnogalacturonyl hydrolase
LNNLAEKFGIHFNGDSENKVIGKNFDMGKIDSLPNHPIFTGVRQLYLKEISTMKLFNYAESILRRGNKSLMANVSYGKGFVFALGDPWFYNEYYDNRKLPVEFENYKAAKNLFLWLFEKCEPAY